MQRKKKKKEEETEKKGNEKPIERSSLNPERLATEFCITNESYNASTSIKNYDTWKKNRRQALIKLGTLESRRRDNSDNVNDDDDDTTTTNKTTTARVTIHDSRTNIFFSRIA